MPRKIYVIGPDKEYANWMEGQLVDDMAKADLVVFTGGEDVCPHIYHRNVHPTTQANINRDGHEMVFFHRARAQNKKCVGICRGSQLLCALSGGALIQDQDNPGFFHPITTLDGREFTMTSTHHQAQYPWDMKEGTYKVLAWTKDASAHHDGQARGIELVYPGAPCQGREVEICHYGLTNCLGIQGHPEMMYHRMGYNKGVAASIQYCRELLNSFMDNKL